MRRHRSLRSRLFSWFVGAIVLAMATSALVVFTTRPEPITGAVALARNVGVRLAALWEDPEGTRAYLGEVRDVTGFDVHLMRDPRRLPPRVHWIAERGGSIAPDGPQHIFIPVVRDGTLLGALEMERFGPRPVPWAWWRFALALFLVVAVLSAMAGAVANLLADPLERLATAADRFGSGDLAFRTDVGGRGRRWVAQEVRDVAVRFNRMAQAIEAMVRGQRELLGAISHELRSPLARARVALEIVRDRVPPEGAGTALDDVERQLGAVDAILGDLLDAARSGLADLRKEPRNLVDWLGERIADEPSPPETRIELQVTREGDSARVTVRDRGAGFPAGFVERAFDPFVRGDTSRARPAVGAGYGLGLAIVKRIVEAHGGRVFARNAGQGAEVGFELPMTPAAP